MRVTTEMLVQLYEEKLDRYNKLAKQYEDKRKIFTKDEIYEFKRFLMRYIKVTDIARRKELAKALKEVPNVNSKCTDCEYYIRYKKGM